MDMVMISFVLTWRIINEFEKYNDAFLFCEIPFRCIKKGNTKLYFRVKVSD